MGVCSDPSTPTRGGNDMPGRATHPRRGPLVDAPVLSALRDEPAPSSGKPDVAAALAAIAPI